MTRAILCLLAVLFLPLYSQASHIAGGEISYRYIGDSTGIPRHYMVYVNLYKNFSSSVPMPATQTLQMSSACSPSSSHTLLRYIPQGAQAAGDGGYFANIDQCVAISANSLYKISVHSYRGAVILSGSCTFTLLVNAGFRSNVYNLNAGGSYLYLNSFIDQSLGPNTSPRFLQHPLFKFCVGQNAWNNFSVVEPDLDSVFFYLTAPQQNSSGSLHTYASGYSAKQPLSTQSGVKLDSVDGMLTFIPDMQDIIALKIVAAEYRYDTVNSSWLYIGNTSRDLTYNISATCAPSAQLLQFNRDSLAFDHSATAYCQQSVINISTVQPYLISSLPGDSSGFRIVGNSTTYTSSSISPTSLVNTQYATGITIRLQQTLMQSDTLRIIARGDSSGAYLQNTCGFKMALMDSVKIAVIDTCTANSIDLEDLSMEGEIRIYPNPASDLLYVDIPAKLGEGNYKLLVVDINGRKLMELTSSRNNNTSETVEISRLQKGVYFIAIEFDSGEMVCRKVLRK